MSPPESYPPAEPADTAASAPADAPPSRETDPPPPEPVPQLSTAVAAFPAQVHAIQLDAAMQASRAREYAAEWMLGGLVCAVVYLFVLVVPRGSVQFIDVIIIAIAIGGGMVMLRHEWQRSQDLMMLVAELDKATRRT